MNNTITRDNYFSFPGISNSQLTDLKLQLQPNDVVLAYENAYRLGTLLDAMCLWPDKVDYLNKKILGQPYNYTHKEFDHYRKMRDAFFKDSFVKELLLISELQRPFFNEESKYYFNGMNFTLPGKNLYDGYMPVLRYGWDLKKTKATTQQGFLQSVIYFSYDRQGAFYCNNSQSVKQHIIIGVSEVNLKVFHVLMDEGKDTNGLWASGENEMNELAFKHYMLKN